MDLTDVRGREGCGTLLAGPRFKACPRVLQGVAYWYVLHTIGVRLRLNKNTTSLHKWDLLASIFLVFYACYFSHIHIVSYKIITITSTE